MTPRLLPLLAALLALGAAGCDRGNPPHRQILFLSDRDGGWALYTMDADGGHHHRVFGAGHTDPGGSGVGFGEPVVSPDGRKVLLARHGVSVANLATGASRRLSEGEEAGAAWSPDGTHVVFSGPQTEGLYVVDLRSGRKRTLDSTSQTWTPAWSPDGKWIAFARQDGYGPTEVYAARPDGSGLTRVSRYAPEGGLAWSRDGKLAFISSRKADEPGRLLVIEEGTWRVHVLEPRLDGGTVAWSPDGRTIAYAATTGRSNASAIYTFGADGRDRRRLTPPWPPSSDDSPVWSPDGKSILFVRTPFGGGAKTEVSEVWSMHADGSHRRQLTTAYPDGGDNLEPAWVNAPVHTETAQRPKEMREGNEIVLRVPFAVDGVAAEGGHAAVAPVGYEPGSDIRPTPPVLVWQPGHGEPARLVSSPCGAVYQLVLAGARLAFDCDHTFFDEVAESMWVVDLRTRIPHQVFFGHGGVFGYGGPAPRGMFLDYIVGSGGLLAFGSETDSPHRLLRRTLWRVDGFFSVAIRSGPGIGNVVAAGGGRLAAELADGRTAILSASGARLAVLRTSGRRSLDVAQFLLAGRRLLLLDRRTLRAYDTSTGKLRWARRVPAGAHLEAADGRLIVFTAGPSVHVLSRRHDTVIRTSARAPHPLGAYVDRLVHAALTANGLYYCFDVADARDPGRVVFVPRAALAK